METTNMATTVLQAKFNTNRPSPPSFHRPMRPPVASPKNSNPGRSILACLALAAITLVVTWAAINVLSGLLLQLERYTLEDFLTAVSDSDLPAAPLLPK